MIWLISDQRSPCFEPPCLRLFLWFCYALGSETGSRCTPNSMFDGHGSYSCRRGISGRLGQHLLNVLYLVDA
ncbi:hypothetical protein B0H14DRAFT_415476 [Mycena olivaceomarginata]|nr:hypothetical protein B0H14DRAFT_415476 [Mycena olivaceomarginata]